MDTTGEDVTAIWLSDEARRVRVFADVQHRVLPPSTPKALSVGTDRSCWWRLHDSEGRISHHHGDFTLREGKWRIEDAGSRNGIIVDGRQSTEFVLEPAQEIHLGGTTLIVESHRSMLVHRYLSRVIGWNDLLAIDLAMRALRMATMRGAALLLQGSDSLISIAYSLHCLAFGADRPFAIASRVRPHNSYFADDNKISITESGVDGLRLARRGSLCVFTDRLPRDYVSVERRFPHPDTKVMLIRCGQAGESTNGMTPIAIPSLASRANDLPRIIQEYAEDAKIALGTAHGEFSDHWIQWVTDTSAENLEQIERATLRLVALRQSDSVYAASKLVGHAPQTVAKWIKKHGLPEGLKHFLKPKR